MQVLPTHVNPRSDAYAANRNAFLEALAYLDEQLAIARAGGGAEVRRAPPRSAAS